MYQVSEKEYKYFLALRIKGCIRQNIGTEYCDIDITKLEAERILKLIKECLQNEQKT